jgi:hypothetical protein
VPVQSSPPRLDNHAQHKAREHDSPRVTALLHSIMRCLGTLDEAMDKAGIPYIRYVDDIRVLANSEDEVRRAAVVLEMECRRWSLIPQGSKFKVRHGSSGLAPEYRGIDGPGPPWSPPPRRTAADFVDVYSTPVSGAAAKHRGRVRFPWGWALVSCN